MPKKLKKLAVTKVDFVDAGANQRANIAIFKHAPKGGEHMKKGSFEEMVQSAVQIVAKKFGLTEKSKGTPVSVKKNAYTFSTVANEASKEQVYNEIWDVTRSLRNSLCSIIEDDTVENKAGMLKQSIAEFQQAANSFADAWGALKLASVKKSLSNDVPTAEEITFVKKRYEDMVKKAGISTPENTPPTEPKEKTKTQADKAKGNVKKLKEDDEMKIDKSRMTPDELAFLDDIEKRYAVTEPAPEPKPVKKSVEETLKEIAPELADVLGNVQKRLQAQEDAEMVAVAKKYEILGKKAEELAPVLKKTKAANPEAYTQLISTLDNMLEITKKSSAFTEIGTNGNNGSTDAAAQIAKHAEEIRKSNPKLSIYEARDLAYQQHPELIDE